MSTDEPQHVALPKLYGAAAYARPPRPVDDSPRPFDPDELPITALQSEDERELLHTLPARAYAPGGGVILGAGEEVAASEERRLEGRPLRLKHLAGRLLGGR